MVSKYLFLALAFWAVSASEAHRNYTGHKVITAVPSSQEHIDLIKKLRSDYSADLWNEPKSFGQNVMIRLRPELIKTVEDLFKQNEIPFDVAFHDLQSAIEEERRSIAEGQQSAAATGFDFGSYHPYEPIIKFMKDITANHGDLVKMEIIGKTYENRPIYNLKISANDNLNKPVILMDCGVHPREWSSVAAGTYFINRLVTTYATDPVVKSLLDKYEFNIILLVNPDGYIYTWEQDRLWRKTRSRSRYDFMGVCLGTDVNRNFDIDHCGLGTSRKPCDEIYCGDKPFSESETRTMRDMMINYQDRMAAYFSLHAFSQLWMVPYGYTKKLPATYDDLMRVGKAGVDALAKKYGTQFELGSIANIIYEAAGSSVDYIYDRLGVKMAFALELRDTGRHGFILPKRLIIPTCEETYDGLVAAIQAL